MEGSVKGSNGHESALADFPMRPLPSAPATLSRWFAAIFLFFRVLLPLADIVTDVANGVSLATTGDPYWGAVSIALIFLPLMGRGLVVLTNGLTADEEHRRRQGLKWITDLISFSPLMPFSVLAQFWLIWRKSNNGRDEVAKLLFRVTELGLYEAFLESAPQAVLQLSIVLRQGYVAGSIQLLSIVMSLLSLALTSCRSFYALRLKQFADPSPQFLPFLLPLILPYALVIMSQLLAWTVILAYAGPWTILMLAVTVAGKYGIARMARSRSERASRAFDERPEFKEQEWTAILVSVVSPCVVILSELKVLLLSSKSSVAFIFLWLLTLLAFANLATYEASGNPPITHCVPYNGSEEVGHGAICSWSVKAGALVDCYEAKDWLCSGTNCPDRVRVCGSGEHPAFFLSAVVLPFLSCLLIGSFFVCWTLNWLADYRNYYRATSWLTCSRTGSIHWNLLFDLAEDRSEEGDRLINEIKETLTRKRREGSKLSRSCDCLLHWVPADSIHRTVDQINLDGQTPLHKACAAQNARMVNLLLLLGSSVSQADHDKMTPLHVAANAGDLESTRLLLDGDSAELDVNAAAARGRTPLICAAMKGHTGVARAIVEEARTGLNLADDGQRTALNWASRLGLSELVWVLLQRRADPNVADSLGRTALLEAAAGGHLGIVSMLLDATVDVDVNARTTMGEAPLMAAAGAGHVAVVERLLSVPGVDANLCDEGGQTALYAAASKGHKAVVAALLDSGKDIDLHKATKGNVTALMVAKMRKDDEVVSMINRRIRQFGRELSNMSKA